VLAIGAVSGFLVPALWILAVLGSATVAWRFGHAYRELARLEAARQRGAGGQLG